MSRRIFTRKMLPMALATALAMSPVQALAVSNDLSGSEKVITEWQEKGLMKGYADGSFRPDSNVTRAEFVVMMNNALGFEAADDISFTDVKAGAWYYNAVAKAVTAGYSKGYTDGSFKPGAAITRAEAAVMIANAADLEVDETGVLDFTDASAIPAWARGSIGAAVKAGFMSGYTDGSFGAAKSITRAKAVSLLNRVMSDVVIEEIETEEIEIEEAVIEDIIVTEADTVVEDGVVTGNLIIDEAVGDGEVYLSNLEVEGDIIVNGGGDDSIYMENVTVHGKVRINKKGVRVHMSGNTNVPQLEVHEVFAITSENFEGEVGTITIIGDLGTGTRVIVDVPADTVVLEGRASVAIEADVTKVEIGEDAEGARVEVAKAATVDTIVADAKVTIAGSGKVDNLEANADGITVNKNVDIDKTETAAGVSKPTTGGSSSGGSSSGGGSDKPDKPGTSPETPEKPGAGEDPGESGQPEEEKPVIPVIPAVSAGFDKPEVTIEEGTLWSSQNIKVTLQNAAFKAGESIYAEEDENVGIDTHSGNLFVSNADQLEVRDVPYVYTFKIPADRLEAANGAVIPSDGLTVTFKLTVTEKTYTITTTTNIEGAGTVTASYTTAKAGETVTLTASPNAGYRFVSWTVIDLSDPSAPIEVTENTFIMPAGEVKVSAAFEAIEITGYTKLSDISITGDQKMATIDMLIAGAGLPTEVTLQYAGGEVKAAITGWTYAGNEYTGAAGTYTFNAVGWDVENAGYVDEEEPFTITVNVVLDTAQEDVEVTGFRDISYTFKENLHLLTAKDIEDQLLKEVNTVELEYDRGTVDARVIRWEYAGGDEYSPENTDAEYEFTAEYELPPGYKGSEDLTVTIFVELGVPQTAEPTNAIAAEEEMKLI